MTRTLLFLCVTSVLMASPKLANELKGPLADRDIDVNVVYRTAPADAKFNGLRSRGKGQLKKLNPHAKSATLRIRPSELAHLLADSDVAYVAPDRAVAPYLDTEVPAVGGNIAHQYNWQGTGIGIAVIDSEIDGLERDLRVWGSSTISRVVYSESFLDSAANPSDNSHGTHVAGIIAGNGGYSVGSLYFRTFRGMAPEANLVSLRVLDKYGVGKDSGVIAAINRAIQLKATHNIRVINLSLGRPVYESYTVDPLCQAVEAAWNAGIVVVAAAGNYGRLNTSGNQGYGTITSPGNDPLVITVGAVNSMGTASRADDILTTYSSKGPTAIDHVVKPDLLAPGNQIVSVRDGGYLTSQYPSNEMAFSTYRTGGATTGDSDYFRLSGTSMAAPMVSGAVALLLQKTPGLTPDQVKARLMRTATKSFAPSYSLTTASGATQVVYSDIFSVGAGYLDAWAALNDTTAATGSARSPSAVYNSSTNTVSLVLGTNIVWGSNIVWGTNIVWGSNIVWGTNIVWGYNIVWGTSGTTGFNIIWGSAGMTGDPKALAAASDVGYGDR
jgi:serine protease AprX